MSFKHAFSILALFQVFLAFFFYAPVAEATHSFLDTSFSTDGKLTSSVQIGGYRGLARQSDGKVLVAGYVSGPHVAVARYNTDGTLDTNFGTSGVFSSDLGIASSANAGVAVQSNGKVVFAGEGGSNGSWGSSLLVGRLNSDGTLDSGFDSDGWATTTFSGYSAVNAYATALQADGKIVVVGSVGGSGGDNVFVARYNTDGTLDTTFDSDGKVVTSLTSGYDEAESVAIQADGKIVVAGVANNKWFVARYTSSGSLDTGFDSDGVVLETGLGTTSGARDVVIQSNGRIVVAGSGNVSGAGAVVVRYLSDGSHDTDFGSSGVYATNFGGNGTGYALAVSLQSDGKIVIGGQAQDSNWAYARFGTARVTTSGATDTTFANSGVVTTDMGAAAYSSAMLPDTDKLLVGGQVSGQGGWGLAQYSGLDD